MRWTKPRRIKAPRRIRAPRRRRRKPNRRNPAHHVRLHSWRSDGGNSPCLDCISILWKRPCNKNGQEDHIITNIVIWFYTVAVVIVCCKTHTFHRLNVFGDTRKSWPTSWTQLLRSWPVPKAMWPWNRRCPNQRRPSLRPMRFQTTSQRSRNRWNQCQHQKWRKLSSWWLDHYFLFGDWRVDKN